MTHIQDGVEYHTHFLVSERDASNLEGQLLTLVELVGLKDKIQEEALKSEIRQKIWGGCFVNRNTETIYGEEMPEVRKLCKELEAKRITYLGGSSKWYVVRIYFFCRIVNRFGSRSSLLHW